MREEIGPISLVAKSLERLWLVLVVDANCGWTLYFAPLAASGLWNCTEQNEGASRIRSSGYKVMLNCANMEYMAWYHSTANSIDHWLQLREDWTSLVLLRYLWGRTIMPDAALYIYGSWVLGPFILLSPRKRTFQIFLKNISFAGWWFPETSHPGLHGNAI